MSPGRVSNFDMKKRRVFIIFGMLFLLCFFFLPLSRAQAKDQESVKVLFIGNSYTFFNSMPQMFVRIARQKGYQVDIDLIAPGGWTLSKHSANQATLSKIKQTRWDYVVLQEQSIIPSVSSYRMKNMYPAARKLDRMIRRSGAKTIFFMTWGRRNGLAKHGFRNYKEMQMRVSSGYMTIAKELNATVAPVGLAFQKARLDAPLLDFWEQDNSHPNQMGSYLAACVFFSVIFQESPQGTGDPYNLGQTKAAYLQKVAAETVLSNRKRWNLP